MWGTPERVPDAADIRRAIPLRRGLRGGDHDDAGLCSLVQGRTAALRLSKRVWLCRDAIHHAVTPRPCAPPHRRASSRWTRPGREGGPNCALRGVGRGGPTSAPRTARRGRSVARRGAILRAGAPLRRKLRGDEYGDVGRCLQAQNRTAGAVGRGVRANVHFGRRLCAFTSRTQDSGRLYRSAALTTPCDWLA